MSRCHVDPDWKIDSDKPRLDNAGKHNIEYWVKREDIRFLGRSGLLGVTVLYSRPCRCRGRHGLEYKTVAPGFYRSRLSLLLVRLPPLSPPYGSLTIAFKRAVLSMQKSCSYSASAACLLLRTTTIVLLVLAGCDDHLDDETKSATAIAKGDTDLSAAEQVARDELAKRWRSDETAHSWVAAYRGDSGNPNAKIAAFYEVKGLKLEVVAEALTEADKLNGATWKGRARAAAAAERQCDMSELEEHVWRSWRDISLDEVWSANLRKTNGEWKIIPRDFVRKWAIDPSAVPLRPAAP